MGTHIFLCLNDTHLYALGLIFPVDDWPNWKYVIFTIQEDQLLSPLIILSYLNSRHYFEPPVLLFACQPTNNGIIVPSSAVLFSGISAVLSV
mgnify:CR=1 FL=1